MLLKVIVFAGILAFGMSVNGSSRERKEDMPGLTILVQNPRTVDNTGLGVKDSRLKNNFSQELVFTMQICACADQTPSKFVHYNHRSYAPLIKIYSLTPVEIECLMKRRKYEQAPLVTIDTARQFSNCSWEFFDDGADGIVPTPFRCKAKVSSHACFPGRFGVGCAVFYTEGGQETLYARVTSGDGTRIQKLLPRVRPLTRGKDTLAVIIRYLVHDTSMSAEQAFLVAVHQTAPNSTMQKIRTELVTEIDVLVFWSSLAIILVVLGPCCCLALTSMLYMKHKNFDLLDLVFSLGQIARLARMLKRRKGPWYVKLHPRLSRVTVSLDGTKTGPWTEEEVVNKERMRE